MLNSASRYTRQHTNALEGLTSPTGDFKSLRGSSISSPKPHTPIRGLPRTRYVKHKNVGKDVSRQMSVDSEEKEHSDTLGAGPKL